MADFLSMVSNYLKGKTDNTKDYYFKSFENLKNSLDSNSEDTIFSFNEEMSKDDFVESFYSNVEQDNKYDIYTLFNSIDQASGSFTKITKDEWNNFFGDDYEITEKELYNILEDISDLKQKDKQEMPEIFKNNSKVQTDENGKPFVTADLFDSSKKDNIDCDSRLIQNIYGLSYWSEDGQKIFNAIIEANPQLAATKEDGTKYLNLHPGDKINLIDPSTILEKNTSGSPAPENITSIPSEPSTESLPDSPIMVQSPSTQPNTPSVQVPSPAPATGMPEPSSQPTTSAQQPDTVESNDKWSNSLDAKAQQYVQDLLNLANYDTQGFNDGITNLLNDSNISLIDKFRVLDNVQNFTAGSKSKLTQYFQNDDSFYVNALKTMAKSDEYSIDDVIKVYDIYDSIQDVREYGDVTEISSNVVNEYLRTCVELFEKAEKEGKLNYFDKEFRALGITRLPSIFNEHMSSSEADSLSKRLINLVKNDNYSKDPEDYGMSARTADGLKKQIFVYSGGSIDKNATLDKFNNYYFNGLLSDKEAIYFLVELYGNNLSQVVDDVRQMNSNTNQYGALLSRIISIIENNN